jgi:hypothetical protein
VSVCASSRAVLGSARECAQGCALYTCARAGATRVCVCWSARVGGCIINGRMHVCAYTHAMRECVEARIGIGLHR